MGRKVLELKTKGSGRRGRFCLPRPKAAKAALTPREKNTHASAAQPAGSRRTRPKPPGENHFEDGENDTVAEEIQGCRRV